MSKGFRAALLGLLLVEGAAHADVIPPTTRSCTDKAPGDACMFERQRGVCRLVSGTKLLPPMRRPDGSFASQQTPFSYVDCDLSTAPAAAATGSAAPANSGGPQRRPSFWLRLGSGLALLGLGVLVLRLAWRRRARAGDVKD